MISLSKKEHQRRSKVTHQALWRSLLKPLVVCLMSVSSLPGYATGLIEVTGGGVWATGGSLESSLGYGAQLTIGWGGRPSFTKRGTALYGYGALSLDRINQVGATSLGKPTLETDQITFTAGVRVYQKVAEDLRIWIGLGAGQTFQSSTTSFIGLTEVQTNIDGVVFHPAVGLQWRLREGMMFSIGYDLLFYQDSKYMGLTERSLLAFDERESFGRGRFALGLGWTL